ncbi:MAG: glycosyl hydrolase 108 family protein [Cyanobacteria bacterium P01_C01_bin.69]
MTWRRYALLFPLPFMLWEPANTAIESWWHYGFSIGYGPFKVQLVRPGKERVADLLVESPDFESAYQFVRNHEGGYVNHANDYGGRTNGGITQAWLDKNGGTVGIAATDVAALSEQEIKTAYWHQYDAANCNQYAAPLDKVCLDTAMMHGVGGWNEFKHYAGVDGAVPPKQAAIAVIESRQEYREQRVRQDPTQAVFKPGWLNRDKALLSEVNRFVESKPDTIGARIAAQAMTWQGKAYKPGIYAMCADFIRHVFDLEGVELAVTTAPIDGYHTGPAFANSAYGEDVGEIIRDKAALRPGDLVMFDQTYGSWGPGVITHVGIYVGDGMIIDRPTAHGTVKHRSIDRFNFVAATRPHSY